MNTFEEVKRTPQEQLFNKRTACLYHNQKRRAVPDFTLAEFRYLLTLLLNQKPLCPYCNALLGIDSLSLDHKLPLSRGGTQSMANIQFVCQTDNKAKGNLTHYEYAGLLAALDGLEKKFHNFEIKKMIKTSLSVANSFRIGANRRGKR